MGKVSSSFDKAQVSLETKIFDDGAPPWDVENITKLTDLTEDEVDVTWRMWITHPLVKRGRMKEDFFYEMLGVQKDNPEEQNTAKKMFELLDKDDDQFLEFPEFMTFLFCMESKDLTVDQKLRRSFMFFDRTDSGKISKREMVEALDLLEVHDMEHDKNGKVKIPDHVENLFSLMDFAGDSKIHLEEFVKSAKHYRNLGKFLAVNLLEPNRIHLQTVIKDFMEKEKIKQEDAKRKQQEEKERKAMEKNKAKESAKDK